MDDTDESLSTHPDSAFARDTIGPNLAEILRPVVGRSLRAIVHEIGPYASEFSAQNYANPDAAYAIVGAVICLNSAKKRATVEDLLRVRKGAFATLIGQISEKDIRLTVEQLIARQMLYLNQGELLVDLTGKQREIK
ncbi:MAG TPA: hypothetical protein HA224_00390 [Nanoarchaeota archaeon]|nr:hypothetical protein [Nanoarchaeota archaeon]